MLKFVPMNESDYDEFRKLSRENYIRDIMRGNSLSKEE